MINLNNDWDIYNAMQGNPINKPMPINWRNGPNGMPAPIQQGDISTGPFNAGAAAGAPNLMPLGVMGAGLLASSKKGGNAQALMQMLPMMYGLNSAGMMGGK